MLKKLILEYCDDFHLSSVGFKPLITRILDDQCDWTLEKSHLDTHIFSMLQRHRRLSASPVLKTTPHSKNGLGGADGAVFRAEGGRVGYMKVFLMPDRSSRRMLCTTRCKYVLLPERSC